MIELGKNCPECGAQLIVLYPRPEESRPDDWDKHVLGKTACCKKKIRLSSLLIGPASNLVGRRREITTQEALELLFREE